MAGQCEREWCAALRRADDEAERDVNVRADIRVTPGIGPPNRDVSPQPDWMCGGRIDRSDCCCCRRSGDRFSHDGSNSRNLRIKQPAKEKRPTPENRCR